jgi:uncharacterized membrane protein
VTALGYSVHPLLVALPIGLATATPLCDLARCPRLAFAALFVATVLLAVTGLPEWLDWLAAPSGTSAKRAGAWHAAVQIGALLLSLLGLTLRLARFAATPGRLAFLLSIAGAGLLHLDGRHGAGLRRTG